MSGYSDDKEALFKALEDKQWYYYIDKIKKIEDSKRRRARCLKDERRKTYEGIVTLNVEIMRMILEYCKKQLTQAEMIQIIKAVCMDPDKVSCEKGNSLKSDGILSLKHCLAFNDSLEDMILDYETYRASQYNIIKWPSHRLSINQLRYACFKDKIDYTLYDIKRFYKFYEPIFNEDTYLDDNQIVQVHQSNNCKMKKAMLVECTYNWFKEMKTFRNFIETRSLQKFVCERKDEHGKMAIEVLDIAHYNRDKKEEEQEIIKDYSAEGYVWDKEYYENLKAILIRER